MNASSGQGEPIGLIAGGGRLPIIMAQGMRAAGRRVVAAGLWGYHDADLPEYCDDFCRVGAAQVGRWARVLRRRGVREAVMVGKVQKTVMYDPWRWVGFLPDWRGARLWLWRLRHDRRTDTMLTALADELAVCGVTLIDTTRYIPEHLATAGVMTQAAPTAEHLADIAFGLPTVARMGDLDVGQAIAVRKREVVAVEAIEGTDAMIRRAGELARGRGWVLIKTAKPKQDVRFDVPTVGVNTIAALKEAGAECLAVEAGRVILLDKPQVLAAAQAAGIAVVGVTVGA